MSFNLTLTRSDTGIYRRDDGNYYRASANEPIGVIGTDGRPIGAWIPKALTNLFRDSEPASDPGQGTRTNVTFSACDWALGFNTALDGMVTFGDNSTTRTYYNTAALTASTAYTLAYIVKPDDGNTFTLGSGASDLFRPVIGGSVNTSSVVNALGNGYFFVVTTGTSSTINLQNTGVSKTAGNNAIGFELSAIMCVLGTVNLTLLDYIRTTGLSATRAVTDIRNTSFPLLDNLQGFIDVEINVSSANKNIIAFGQNDNNRLLVQLNSSNQILINYAVGVVVQWAITSIAVVSGRYRISWNVDGTDNWLKIDNAEIGRNSSSYTPLGTIVNLGKAIGSTANPFTDSSFLNLYITSGKTEEELLTVSAFTSLTQFMEFKRATFDDQALTTTAITLLQATEL